MQNSKPSLRDFITDETERRKYFPYPEKAISTSSGEVYIKAEDLLSDPKVKKEIQDIRRFVIEKKLIKRK